MKDRIAYVGTCALVVLSIACSSPGKNSIQYKYAIDDQELYDTIVRLDSILFDAYNNCNTQLEKHASFYSDSIEFYHDKGGLSTSKAVILDGIKKFVCGKVRRDLVKGSIEVYPIPGFGAIEMGLHTFFNNQEPNAASHPSRFLIVWQHTAENGWKIRKVISLH